MLEYSKNIHSLLLVWLLKIRKPITSNNDVAGL